MTQLTEHFSEREFTHSQTAIRYGLDNDMNPQQRAAAVALCKNVLEPVRAHFGKACRLSSGFRGDELNKRVGGSTTSQHSKGEAADFEINGISNKVVAEYIRDNLVFDQLILEGYNASDPNSGWVHVSFKASGKNRKQAMRASFKNGKATYTQGLG